MVIPRIKENARPFLVTKFLEEKDNEQITVSNLVEKMEECLSDK